MGRILRGGRVIPAERVRASATADEILSRARLEADELLQGARHDADRLTADALRHGVEGARSEAVGSLVAARAARRRLLEDMQRDVVRLAIEVARKVISREITQSPDVVLETCSRLIEPLQAARSLVIRVNPAEVDLVRSHLSKLQVTSSPGADIEVEADEAMTRGGCVIESEIGRIDGRLETQLSAIERALLEEIDE